MKYYVLRKNQWEQTTKLYYDLFIGDKKTKFRVSKEKRYNSPRTMRLFTRELVRKVKGTNNEEGC